MHTPEPLDNTNINKDIENNKVKIDIGRYRDCMTSDPLAGRPNHLPGYNKIIQPRNNRARVIKSYPTVPIFCLQKKDRKIENK